MHLIVIHSKPAMTRASASSIQVVQLGRRIEQARLRKGLSLNDLASRAQVRHPTLLRIESGSLIDPSVRTIAALATVLDCTIDSLVASYQPSDIAPASSPHLSSASTRPSIHELARMVDEMERRFARRLGSLEDRL